MVRYFLFFVFLLFVDIFPVMLHAQQFPEWQDPEIVEVNKETAHATLFPYEVRELALMEQWRESAF